MKHVFWLACAVSLLAPVAAKCGSRDRVPSLNVDGSCRDAQDSTGSDPGQTYKNCLADENDARKALVDKWATFKPETRRNCVEAGAAPNPSYVELLTCLEMFNQRLMPTESSEREMPKQ